MTGFLRNEAILASAGSGKTYALSNRVIRLLASGAPPESIVALTFTRKAAAEFTTAVLSKLSDAAASDDVARKLGTELGLRGWSAGGFAELLERLVRALHHLAFGTIDSFFQRIAQSYPFELGIAGRFDLLDQQAAEQTRAKALRSLFRPGLAQERIHLGILQAFREATWGNEDRNLSRQLTAFVDECHQTYLLAPHEHAWGRASHIWPNGWVWGCAGDSAAAAGQAIYEWLATSPAADKSLREGLLKIADAARGWTPGQPLPQVLERVLERWPTYRPGGSGELFFRKEHRLPPDVTQAVAAFARHVVSVILEQRLATARGVYGIIAQYEKVYDALARRSGQLTFSDVLMLLGRSEQRLNWEFRLDARFQHWLFDEFQDTSVEQWDVLGNLVDEVLQDTSGVRSLFFVGDIKQALYSWRGGRFRLLLDLLERYEARLESRPLTRSYRSCAEVVELVNAVGAWKPPAGVAAPGVETWRKCWIPHESALDGSGYAALIRTGKEVDHLAAIERILREIDPVRRGLSCAVLVQTNPHGKKVADYLRGAGIENVVSESDVPVAVDNPLTGAILALFRACAHPADSLAAGYAAMTPLAAWIARHEHGLPAARRRLLRLVCRKGFAAALDQLIEELDGHLPADGFSRLRIEQLLQIARKFDARHSRDMDEFVAFAAETTRRECGAAGSIQVLTVHKAKGLGFDVVLFPIVNNTRIDALRGGALMVAEDDRTHRIQWLIGRPPSAVAAADPVLSKVLEQERARESYEKLCLLYVALTRARRGLYVFADAPGDANFSYAAILAQSLPAESAVLDGGVAWHRGKSQWFEGIQRLDKASIDAPERAHWSGFTRRGIARRVSPHDASSSRVLSTADAGAGRRFGSAIHALFAEIEWIDGASPELSNAAASLADPRAYSAVSACLQAREVRALFTRPPGNPTLWRERAFDVLDGDSWVSGVFDRVILWEDHAVLVDFKTEQSPLASLAARHGGQLTLYRRCLSKLTGLAESAIRAVIIHVPTGSVIELRLEG